MFEFLKSKNKSNNIETKSVQNQLTGSVSSIYSDFNSAVRMPNDSVSILSYNKGYAAVCSRIISQAIADLPYYLYRVGKAKSGKYLGKSVKVDDKEQINKFNKSIKTGDYSLDKVFEHPFLTILEENMKRSITEFFYLVSMYYLTIGNCYILIERDARGNLFNLKILMSEYMSIRYDKDYNITAYVYQPLLGGAV
jgi:phage portal protein BeeE